MTLKAHEQIHKVTLIFNELTGAFQSAQIEAARFWTSDKEGETVPRPDILDPQSIEVEKVQEVLGKALADAIQDRDEAIYAALESNAKLAAIMDADRKGKLSI